MVKDWVQDPNTTVTSVVYVDGAATSVDGAVGNLYDGDLATYYGGYANREENSTVNITTTVILPSEKHLDNIYFKSWQSMVGNAAYNYSGYMKLYDGNDVLIDTVFDYSVSSAGSTTKTVDETFTDGWDNVKKIVIYNHAYSISDGFQAVTYSRQYEIQAFGTEYIDTGKRIYAGGETVAIGGETLDGHKARIYHNGEILGLPMLDLLDNDASPERAYDGIAIKAFPKIT